jgi:signal transduction histidine kinase
MINAGSAHVDLLQLPIASVVLDAGQHVTQISRAAEQLLGLNADTCIGLPAGEVLEPRTLSGKAALTGEWPTATRLASTKAIATQDLTLKTGNGKRIDVSVDGSYMRNSEGILTGAVLILRPRRQHHQRPRSGIRIVSAVSHELRSPLTSLRGYTSLLLKRWSDFNENDRFAMLQQIDGDARRVSRMISELLDISRIEAGRLQLNLSKVEIAQLIDRSLDTVRHSWSDLDTQVEISNGCPSVLADEDKVGQVLTNLVENACKYASPMGISIRVDYDDEEVVVEVSDTGPGIPKADLPNLFQQFFRSREGRPSGTGLGLWISRGLIEAHGGTLTVASNPAQGSTFRFTLLRRILDQD